MEENPLVDFLDRLHDLVRFYLDATRGFNLVVEDTNRAQRQTMEMMWHKNPELANVQYLDGLSMTYGNGDPDNPDAIILGYSSQGDLKARNAKDGVNANIAVYSVILMAYGLWESKYRKEITEFLKLDEPIKVIPIGDIRRFRHDILHCKGICSKEHSSKTEMFKWFSEGDQLIFTQDMFVEILLEIKQCLREEYVNVTGNDLKTSRFLERVGEGHRVLRKSLGVFSD